jgi:hypothetical protein
LLGARATARRRRKSKGLGARECPVYTLQLHNEYEDESPVYLDGTSVTAMYAPDLGSAQLANSSTRGNQNGNFATVVDGYGGYGAYLYSSKIIRATDEILGDYHSLVRETRCDLSVFCVECARWKT